MIEHYTDILSFYLPTVMQNTMFLHSHIVSCSYAFQPSSLGLNPSTVPSQHIVWFMHTF